MNQRVSVEKDEERKRLDKQLNDLINRGIKSGADSREYLDLLYSLEALDSPIQKEAHKATEKILESAAEEKAQISLARRESDSFQQATLQSKLNLMSDKDKIWMEVYKFLHEKYPDTPEIITLGYLRWSRELLGELETRLRLKGLIL